MTKNSSFVHAALGTALVVLAWGCAKVDTNTTADVGLDTGGGDTAMDPAVDTAVDLPADTVMEVPDGGCPDGLTECEGICVDLMTHPDHCGWCGNECAAPFEHTVGACSGGSCGWQCAEGWVDNDEEPGCETACAAGGTEICNGTDDDCDTVVDDGFACSMGSSVQCTTTCSTFGTGTCTMSCEIPGPDACTPPAEECNGIDDDCDGETDEDFPPGTCGTCTPDCTGRECGPDPVCDTSCGTCTAPETCDSSGTCTCTPECGSRECGPDPVCGTSCGDCTAPEVCDDWGVCGCTPDCSGRECGPDPVCGTSCGTCTSPETCDSSGTCVEECIPDCSGRECGADPVCGTICGMCTSPEVCDHTGTCVDTSCTPDCTGRECGPDPICGESCGECTAPATCNSAGVCESGCPPPAGSCTTGSESMDGCSNARTIGRQQAGLMGGFSVSDDLCWSVSDYSNKGSCSDSGPDHTYRIYMLEGESISVYMYTDWPCDMDEFDWNGTLKIIQNTGCDDTSCTDLVVCEDYIYVSTTENHTAPHDGWYFIVVDGSTSFDDEGDYDLTVNLTCNDATTCGC